MHYEAPKLGRFLEEECCPNCDYTGGFLDMGYSVPPMPISICPECGKKLVSVTGQWNYSVKVSWFGWNRDVIRHNFVRKEDS